MIFVLLLALAGLFLIYLEFFLPGAVMAIGGSILLLTSIYLCHLEKTSLTTLILYMMALAAAVYTLVKFALWRVRMQKGVLLTTDQEGYQACLYPKEMIGKTAKVATDLKPSGQIAIENQLFQAISQSGYIDSGCEVRVVGGQGSHLIVTREKL